MKSRVHLKEFAPHPGLSPKELAERRSAVDYAIGTQRIEGIEPEAVPLSILDRYAQGEISMDEVDRLTDEYLVTIIKPDAL
jgi:hypothetical protein